MDLLGDPVACVLDDGRFNEFSTGWYSLCRAFGLEDFEPERLHGRAIGELCPGLVLPGPEAGRDERGSPWWDAWIPWPVPDGLRLTLRPSALLRRAAALENPLFLGPAEGAGPEGADDRALRPANRAARELLAADPTLERSDALERWLTQQAQPRRLARVPDLCLGGDRLWTPLLPSLHGDAGFHLLAKLTRTLLHDMSNPLSAGRMMAEVASRGLRKFSDPAQVLPELIRHLDMATSIMGRLRTTIQVSSRERSLDACAAFAGARDLLQSELDRREVTVDLTALEPPEPELEGHANELLLLALGALLLTLGRAGEGDTLEIVGRVGDDAWHLEGSLRAAETPRPLFADPELGADVLQRLAAPFHGRLQRLAVGENPLWRLDLPL